MPTSNEIEIPRHRYFIVNKPYNMVSQFVSPDDVPLLGNLDAAFPTGIHAIGRLDKASEGLLILTTNKKVTRLLFQGKVPHNRTYLVRIKHELSAEKLELLRTGIGIRVGENDYYRTQPCEIDIIPTPTNLFSRDPELSDRGAHTWLRMTLTEGKYHQIRKMVEAAGHRCQRLIRISIGEIVLDTLAPGQLRELEEKCFFSQLGIDDWRD